MATVLAARWIPIVIWQFSEIAVWFLLTPDLGAVDRSGAVLTVEILDRAPDRFALRGTALRRA